MTTQKDISGASNLEDWLDRSQTEFGCVPQTSSQMIHAALFGEGDAPATGGELPAFWHWCGFPPSVGMSDLGEDGHPKLGDFLPPVNLARRMWASGSAEFHQPIHVGEQMTRQSRIAKISEKSGAAGDMVFVTVAHDISTDAGLCISETQNIVYLNIPATFAPPPKQPVPTDDLLLNEAVPLSEALLFRYSAVTFNAHRIHYDLPYAQQTEHYPALVVHGPLQASLLIAAATKLRGRPPTRFEFRGVHPVFHTDHMRLIAQAVSANEISLCTAVGESHQGMQATAFWKDE